MITKNQDNLQTRDPKFAVLLAAYNGKEWIEAQVDSILSQRDVEVKLFVSVDPSTDETRAWCENLVRNDVRIVLLPDVGVFGGAAKNFFRLIKDVDFSGFDYVSFSDQDDVWVVDKLITAHRQITESGSDAYSSNVIAFWSGGRKELICKSQPQKAWDFLFEAAGPGCTYVLKNSLAISIKDNVIKNWIEIQGVYLHDWYCYAYARANGYKWYIDANPKVFYRQHGDNQIGVNKGFGALIARLRKVVSGFGLEQSRLIGSLVGFNNDTFFMSWCRLRRIDKIKLAFSAPNCRRRRRDQMYFFMACILLSVKLPTAKLK